VKHNVDTLAGQGHGWSVPKITPNYLDAETIQAGITTTAEPPHLIPPGDKLFDDVLAEESTRPGDQRFHSTSFSNLRGNVAGSAGNR
jgi:hypothetical protein